MVVEDGTLRLRCSKGKDPRHQIAVICPVTVSRRAVKRNRIRRIFFEALRLFLKNIEEPLDCVLIVKPGFTLEESKRKEIDDRVATFMKTIIRRL
jgi:ribonuclease P protein component